MRAFVALVLLGTLLAACGRDPKRFFLVDSGPDLRARNLVLSKTTFAPGEQILVGIDIVNEGETGVQQTRVALYASADPVVDTNDTRIGDAPTGSIAFGPNRTKAMTFNATAPLTSGTYSVAAIVDDQSLVSEFDESNNRSNILQITVQ